MPRRRDSFHHQDLRTYDPASARDIDRFLMATRGLPAESEEKVGRAIAVIGNQLLKQFPQQPNPTFQTFLDISPRVTYPHLSNTWRRARIMFREATMLESGDFYAGWAAPCAPEAMRLVTLWGKAVYRGKPHQPKQDRQQPSGYAGMYSSDECGRQIAARPACYGRRSGGTVQVRVQRARLTP